MRIGYVKTSYSSQITVNDDIDMLGLYQVKNLANPVAGEALKKGHAGIVDADVAVGASIAYAKLNLALAVKNTDIALATGIVYSKLNLTGLLVMADLAAAIKNAANGLAVLDASADVPLAQIPDTLTGKDADTLDGEEAAAFEDAGVAAGLLTTHTGDDDAHHSLYTDAKAIAAAKTDPALLNIWSLAEILTPSSDINITSSTFSAHDRWLVMIDVAHDTGAGAEAQVSFQVNGETGTIYAGRYHDNTSIVTEVNVDEIRIGSGQRDTSNPQNFVAWLEGSGKGYRKAFVGGASAGYSATLNSMINGRIYLTDDIVNFTFKFSYAVTGKIKIYYMDY